MRVLRWSFAVLGLVALVLLLVVGGLWTWAGTDGSADWALRQAARRVPGLQAQGVEGSIRHGLRAQRLAWSQDGLQVEATQVELAWQPLALLQRRLQVDRLRAQAVRVDDRRPPTDEPSQPPQTLVLPLAVALDDLHVGRLEVAGRTALQLQDLAAGYGWDGTRHRLDLRNLQLAEGQYSGRVALAGRAPYALEAALHGRVVAPVPGGTATVPLLLDAGATGPLAGFDARLEVRGEPGAAAATNTRALATARVTPWAPVPVASARADLEGLDVGALWPQAPNTLLSGQVAVQPAGTETWAVSADLRNASPGPWDQRRLPAERLRLAGDFRQPQQVLVRDLEARVGGGRVQARGSWSGTQAWTVDATLSGVDPAAVHTVMAPLPLGGRLRLQGEGDAIAFDGQLAAADARRPAPAGSLAQAVGALELRSIRARGRWAGQELSLPLLVVTTSDAKLDGALDYHPARQWGRGRAELEAPGLRLRAVGSLAPRNGGGNVRADITGLAQAQAWLARLPLLPAGVSGPPLDGRGTLQAAWQGGWTDPTVQATATVPLLQDAAAGTPTWVVRDATVRLDGRLADARADLRARAQAGTRDGTLEATVRGGQQRGGAWQGEVASLAVAARDPALGNGPWRLLLRRPVGWRWAGGQAEVAAGEATLAAPVPRGVPSEAQLAWDPVRWRSGQWRTAGRLTGLPMAWIDLLTGPQAGGTSLAGDLVFDGRWDVQAGQALRVSASLARTRGDVSVLAEAADGSNARVQAGVREARVTLDSDGEAVALALRWDSERAGHAEGRLTSRLARDADGWQWPAQAPLEGRVQAQLPRLGVWSLLAPPGWRLRGSLAADIAVAGTRDAPALTGTLRADDLALRSVVDGVALQDGRLRARLDGRRLLVDELVLHGAGPDGGTITGSGEGGWLQDGPQVRVQAQLQQLRASIRSDRELTASGRIDASLDARGAQVRGAVRVDRARITLPDETAPRLGDDVVVRNLPAGVSLGRGARKADPAERGGRPLLLAVALDLGNDFLVTGRGLQARLAGTLEVGGTSLAEPRLTGQIRTVGGEYQAYGQKLEIERGVLRFTGPVDNPALDVLAIRPRMTQRVGVQITGTAQAPFVRLYAEPDLPEAEKLAWLVLGRPAASGGAETALLQSAAVALLESRTGRGGGGRGPAALLGLDDLGFRRDGADGPAVTLGKRLGRNLYASYERSLAGALGTLYIYYDIAQRVTVRAQAGERAAVDLIFTFAYD